MNSFTSLTLRSAWMPPAVAQAPIVTRSFDAVRISRMRSASFAVVIEPSTRERSYGPLTTVRDASRKSAITNRATTASKSSSQFSRVNWQPSHDASFQTASFGLGAAMSDVRVLEPSADAVVAKDRAVLADELGSELAVAAEPDRALHVALHREKDAVGGHSVGEQAAHRVPHHDLRAAHHHHAPGRVDPHLAEQVRHHPDVVAPRPIGAVDGQVHLGVRVPCPRPESFAEHEVPGRLDPVEDLERAVRVASPDDVVDDRDHRRPAEAAPDQDHLLAPVLLQRPPT